MSGVAIEDLLELWSAELRKATARLSWLIGHPSVVASAAAFLDTLLGPERRKTGWMRAEAAGDVGPWRQQAVLGRSHWDADALRDYALETLAEGDAVLVIDESGFLKQGTASCGVARQYTGSAGKITNSDVCCQLGRQTNTLSALCGTRDRSRCPCTSQETEPFRRRLIKL
jgi:SRSO17 transposase